MKPKLLLLFFVFILSYHPGQVNAQVDVRYQKPHEDILELMDAPLPPSLSFINSEGTQGILLYRHSFKSIAELSEPELRLAGLRINPKTFISSRQRYYFSMSLFDLSAKKEMTIDGLPEDGQFSNFSGSPDEKKLSFTNTTQNGVELWVIHRDAGKATRLIKQGLNANMGNPVEWLKDSNGLLVRMRANSAEDIVAKTDVVPTGPTISVNHGQKAQNRTYQDLLKDKTDEQNFDALTLSTIHRVNLDGKSSLWMDADIYADISISPDGHFALVETIGKPYSYLVPYYRFPTRTAVYDIDGQLVHEVHRSGLIEELPQGRGAVPEGMRRVSWRNDKPAALYWVEALDGGDPSKEVPFRDAVFSRNVPFEASAEELMKTENRFSRIIWGSHSVAIATDSWWKDRNTQTYLFNPSDPEVAPKLLSSRNYQDRYSDPGDFATTRNEYGLSQLLQDGSSLYLIGDGYSDEGIHPFLDELNIATGEINRLWQVPKNDYLEQIEEILDIRAGKILTRMESAHDFPNYYFREISNGKKEAITSFENPFESLAQVTKELITYKRDDGVDLSGTLYLPPGYDEKNDEKLPLLLWAYPREYKDARSAGQITSSPNQFTYPSYGSPIFWVLRGFAVLDRAAFPIIGEGDQEPNDEFVEQLVANGKAAIDVLDARGIIDRTRVGVGGHSYGAFMTANLLSHSDLFAAGIARSGAYNRTLTPFGFQSEERTYWEAPEIYYGMSPFMHADKMKTPLLLIHGEADNNSGTYPLQSLRYFNALKGLGATVRLVMLPKESHGYAARESILHMLWEQDQWLEKYVKNKYAGTAMKP